MRRWWLIGACLILLVLTSRVFAIGEPIRSIEDVATIMPDDTALYFVMRTDDQVLKDIDGLISHVTDKLGILGLPAISVEDEIRRSLDEMGITYEDARAAIGDYVAFSVTTDAIADLMTPTGSDVPPGFRMYVQVGDPDAMLEAVTVGNREGEKQNGYTLYETPTVTLAYSPQWVIAMNEPRVPDVAQSLAGKRGFGEVFAELPGQDYGALLYMSPEALALTVEGVTNDLSELTEQHMALGFVLNDGKHLVMDFVQTVPEGSAIVNALPSAPVDPDFLRYVPEDADLVIQLTGMTGYLNYLDAYMEAFSPGFNLRRELERGLDGLNLSLEDDFLSWMDGEALLYTTIDLEALAESNGQLKDLPIELGFVLETSNPRASQRVFDFITRELKKDQNVRVGSATINDVKVTTIQLDIPNGASTMSYELMMGATDEVAFIASNEVTQFLTSGRGDSLLDNQAYNEASELYLPQTKQVLYASDEGVIAVGGGLASLFLFGGGIDIPGFPNIQSSSPNISYQPGSTGFILELARSVLHSASVTSTINNGFQVSRFVFSLE